MNWERWRSVCCGQGPHMGGGKRPFSPGPAVWVGPSKLLVRIKKKGKTDVTGGTRALHEYWGLEGCRLGPDCV